MSTSYSYIHCRPDGTPFYVGKGSLRRAKYLGERNSYHQAIVHKDGKENILIGLMECSSSDIAYELERGVIKCFKRMGVKLTNFTDGGEGGKNPCEETRKRLSEAAKKRGVSLACQQAKVLAKRGKSISKEQRAKQSASMKGKVFSEQHKKNISIGAKKRGVSTQFREAAKLSNIGRVHTKEERCMRGDSIRKTLVERGKTIRISVDGVQYESVSEAARSVGIIVASLIYGLRNSGIVKGHSVEYVK